MTPGEEETSFQIYLRQIAKFPLLTAEQEVELAARIKLGDQQARADMVRANLKLVVRIARDYANFGLPLLDLISEGNIGLMKAVERFDPAKGGKLRSLCSLVDQGVDSPRSGQPGKDHSPASSPRR